MAQGKVFQGGKSDSPGPFTGFLTFLLANDAIFGTAFIKLPLGGMIFK